MIKVFYPDKNGKIVFTKEELERLLKEVYEEGKSDGNLIYTPAINYGSSGTESNPYEPIITCNSSNAGEVNGVNFGEKLDIQFNCEPDDQLKFDENGNIQ